MYTQSHVETLHACTLSHVLAIFWDNKVHTLHNTALYSCTNVKMINYMYRCLEVMMYIVHCTCKLIHSQCKPQEMLFIMKLDTVVTGAWYPAN